MTSAIQTPAPNRSNSFKVALAAKQRQIGFWLAMNDPYLAEVNVTVGFDWLLIDSKHAPDGVRTILAQLRAVAPCRTEPIVQPCSGDPTLIKHLLDIGARTLLVSMVGTAGQAHDLVRMVRYPPFDIRGVGGAVDRASRWNTRTNYLQVADDEACLLVQAETVIAPQSLKAIYAMDGVDDVFIGPADLAASMSHRGNASHPEIQAVIDNAMYTVIASSRAASTLASDPMLARHYLELGCTFAATGIDILLFTNGARKLARDFIALRAA